VSKTIFFKTSSSVAIYSLSGKCAKLHTVAATSNDGVHMPWSLYYCLFTPRIYGCCSSLTSRSWWIAHSTQRQQRLQQYQ